MARTLSFSGTLSWPLEDGQQSAKVVLSTSLAYTSALYIEKLYTSTATDEDVALPMTAAKFMLLQAQTADITVKLNGSTTTIALKAGTGYVLVNNSDGTIDEIKVTVAAAPATLKGYLFA